MALTDASMEPEYRVDLFVSFPPDDPAAPNLTMRELAAATEYAVRNRPNFLRTEPSIFHDSMALGGENVLEAILQSRPNGVGLFLLTPAFFRERRCVAEFRAFLEVQSDPEVNLKHIFVCFGSVDDILSPSVKEEVRALPNLVLKTDITVTSIQATTARLTDLVFEAWECTNNLSPLNFPTVLGRTRDESFLALQRIFTVDDLSTIRAVFSLPRNETENVLDAFGALRDRNIVTKDNVQGLRAVIRHRSGPAEYMQRRMLEAYERKWIHSDRLDWGVQFRQKLLLLTEKEVKDVTQASSSSQHLKHPRSTSADTQVTSVRNAKRPRETTEQFKPYFDRPLQPSNVVLDFESNDAEGNPVTAEGLLLRKLLEPLKGNDSRSVSACGKRTRIHGMGGVGKTTALRALCYEEEVKKAYSDGVCFLEFGEDADDRKVIKQVARCVRIFGGTIEAQEMNDSDSLSDVLERCTVWLRDRTILLVCDDLWKNERSTCGYLRDITSLLREAPRSGLVISTRDRNIAISTDKTVEFASLDPEGDKARKILLAGVPDIDAGAKIADTATEDCIRRILRICAGLPLALAIAGRGLGKTRSSSNSLSNRVRRYCALLEQDVGRITEEELEDYPGLAKVINSILRHCQEWGSSDEVEQMYGRKFDMEYMFKGLCVLQKQMVMPMRALKHVWGTNDKCTNEVMEIFAHFYLVNCSESSPSTGQEYGLRLHDLVLLRCQRMAGDEHSNFHKRMVDAYGEKVGGDRNRKEGEEDVEYRAWWDVHNDGYVYPHLSRHLVLSGCAQELRSLLCDIRWTMRRMEVGGWMSLNVDFERLFGAQGHADRGIMRVHEVLRDSTPYARERHNLLAFFVCAHLSPEDRNELPGSSLFQSICRHFPKPWLLPLTLVVAARDQREKWKAVFQSRVGKLVVDWTRGKVLITNNESIISWCTNEHRILRKIPHKARCIAIDADWKFIVSGSLDGKVRRWDAASGAPIGEPLYGHTQSVSCVAVSADGKFIVSGSHDDTVRLWDAASGASIGEPLYDFVNCVALSPDGKFIVSGSVDGKVRRWDAASGAPIGEPLYGRTQSVTCVAVSADGKVIVSGSYDNKVRLWNAESGAPIGEPLCGHTRYVTCVAVSADGMVIVSGSEDKTMRLWDAKIGAPIGDPFRGHENGVTCVSVSADGKSIVSASDDKTVRGWDVEKHSSELILVPENHVSAVPVSSDRSATFFSSNNNRERYADPYRNPHREHTKDVTCVAVSPDDKFIVSGSRDKTVWRWDGESGAPIGEPLSGHTDWVTCVAVKADRMVSGSRDKTVRLWDAESGAPIGEPLSGHTKCVNCVALTADGKVLVSGSDDKTVRLWDAASGAPIGEPLCGHYRKVTCVAISADGKVLVSGSSDLTVRLWDAESRAPIGEPLKGHRTTVKCVSVSADGILSMSDDKMQRWDDKSRMPIGNVLIERKDRLIFFARIHDGFVDMPSSDAPQRVGGAVLSPSRRNALEGILSYVPDVNSLAMCLDSRFVVIGSRKRVVICRWVE